MEILSLDELDWTAITWNDAVGGRAAQIANGQGVAHVRMLRLEAGGSIGSHETGSGQLRIPIEGDGWCRRATAHAKPCAAVMRRSSRAAPYTARAATTGCSL